jgi:Flp pilus assembly protein TadD
LGRCNQALTHYQKVATLERPDYRLLVDWALAYDCLNQSQEALNKLEQAATLERTAHVYALIGMIHGKNSRVKEAEAALAEAEKLDPRFDMTYVYRGNLRLGERNFAAAARDYRHALELNPRNQAAADALSVIQARR